MTILLIVENLLNLLTVRMFYYQLEHFYRNYLLSLTPVALLRYKGHHAAFYRVPLYYRDVLISLGEDKQHATMWSVAMRQ